ncbi:MAG: methanogenesis marker 2 protein [Candidatus Methanomethylophilaceae archaeon]|nr:methanogenesis marker 2 protein [Candidatus Methanomethylophilaceae archaeon]MBR7006477.1 methanogenesis marker 2 protein [Candidatus Methanomethylophilaceae archaeon]
MPVVEMAEAIRSFPGVTRKNKIHEVVDLFPTSGFPQVHAAEGEDAAALDVGDQFILFAADGIMESLMVADPYMAGYFAVLVNVNDIAAMGGRPLGMVDVMSMGGRGEPGEIIRGMQEGVRKFGVPIVGGHTHPDCDYDAIDISIVGRVAKDAVLLSSTAREGDDVVFVIDTEGYYQDNLPYAYITTVGRSDEMVRAQMEAAAAVGERHLAHACKDMSNPGHIGTLGMMLESSGKGALVDVRRIPIPDGVDPIRWALTYQGCGFVFSCPPECSDEVISLFSEVGCEGAVVGKVDGTRRLRITDGIDTATVFDFSTDIITGCSPRRR